MSARRLLAIIAGAAAALVPAAASAQVPSNAQFSSPPRAASGTPMWVRSVTPCPAAAGHAVFRYVDVWFTSPGSVALTGGAVRGDVRDDGSWEVSLPAPGDVALGSTAGYYVRAECLVSDTWVEGEPVVSLVYEVNQLHITSVGGSGGGGGASSPAASATAAATSTASDATATVSDATADATTTVDDAASAATELTDAVQDVLDDAVTTQSYVDDEAARAAELRAELAADDENDDAPTKLSLVASAASSSRPGGEVDGGIPAWAFVAATMLAIGSVIAWGTRRASTID